MHHSSLKQLWNGNKLLKSLKILDLSHSHGLTNTPNFSELPNLERLILKDCINLIEVHESIGELGRLVLLNLKDCKNLVKLPSKIGQLKCLEKLVLSGCSKLGKMERFEVPHSNRSSMNQSTSVTTEVRSWLSQCCSWVPRPRKRPDAITFSLSYLSRSLTSLSLSECNLSDDNIPRDLGSLSSLQYLDLSGNLISCLPESINCLTMLQRLSLEKCTRLQSLPELPMSLEELDLTTCRSLEVLTNIPNLLSSSNLYTHECDNLIEVQQLFKLEPLGNFDAVMTGNLGFSNLESLANVEVYLFNNMSVTKRKIPLQGLYEFGIFSTFLPGSEVSDWFSIKSMGSSICFKVPSFPNLKIQGLSICVVYAQSQHQGRPYKSNQFYIKASNRTKDMKWSYCPTFVGMPDEGEDMIWLSHWKIDNLLDVGDEVSVSACLWNSLDVKEFGIHVLLEQEQNGIQYNNAISPYCSSASKGEGDGDLSMYQVRTGAYYLCYHDTEIYEKSSVDDKWTEDWYEELFGDSEASSSVGPLALLDV